MGTVYRAWDAVRGCEIALKLLHDRTPEGLLELKREFRTISRLAHPNLVQLHELHADGDPACFTMELIDGVELLTHLGAAPDPAEVRRCVADVARGLTALHRAGLLHRDLKPGNVMVARDGRVVLLDLGLSLPAIAPERTAVEQAELAGTLAYLPPEAFEGAPPDVTFDAYALGVTLYEVLCGRPPGPDDLDDMLRARSRRSFQRPSSGNVVLDELAWRLLDPSPETRLTLDGVLEALDVGRAAAPDGFVGRDDELARLSQALGAARDRPRAVTLEGPSGIGKTTLARRFVREASKRGARVFSGRCHAREQTPFRALDGVVDALVRHLRDERRAELLPDEPALGRLFPVFLALRPDWATREPALPQVARERAVRALRELFGALAAEAPVVVWIDDGQEADPDSVRLLEDVLASPDGPPLMLLVTLRPESGGDGAPTRSLGLVVPDVDHVRLPLRGLSAEEIRTLTERAGLRRLFPEGTGELWSSTAGNPFLVAEQLDRLCGGASVDERLDGLAVAEREVMQRVGVAGRPLSAPECLDGVDVVDGLAALQRLEGQRLLRREGAAESERYVPYHDRIGVAVRTRLDPARVARLHGALADAVRSHGDAAPEQVLAHLQASGRLDEAFPFALAGGRRAVEQLAFDRAASLYRVALETAPEHARPATRRALAEALALGGRGPEAGALFAELAGEAAESEAAELEQRAMEQFLYSGHHEEGVAAARRVLVRVGDRMPRSAAEAMLCAFVLHNSPRIRRLDDRPARRPADPNRIDVLHAVSLGMSFTQPILSAALGYRHLSVSLGTADPATVARALALHMAQYAFFRFDPDYAEGVRARAHRLAEASGSPEARALVRLTTAGVAWAEGRFATCVALTREESPELSRDRPGLRWHRATWRIVHLEGLLGLGEHDRVAALLPEYVADARARGDLHLLVNLEVRCAPRFWLSRDRPDLAAESLRRGLAAWAGRDVDTIALIGACNAARIGLYQDDPAAAWRAWDETWPKASRAMLLTMGFHKLVAWPLRARAALALARRGGLDVRRAEQEAFRALRALRGLGPLAEVEARVLRAELSSLGGVDPGPALREASPSAGALGLQTLRAAIAELEEPTPEDAWEGTAVRNRRAFARQLVWLS